MKNSYLLILGFFAGFGSAFLGIGGGVVMVPSLVLLLDYDIKKAVGTSLTTIVPAALVGVSTHYILNSDNILFISALFIILGSVAGAKIGAAIADRIRGDLIRVLFAALLLFVGLKQVGLIRIPTESVLSINSYPFFVILGLIAGISSALFGIGGGAIMVPSLDLFFGFQMHQAIATSLTVIVPTSAAGAIFHAKLNNIDRRAVRFLIPASLLGAILGAILSNMLTPVTLRYIFGFFVIFFSVKMFLKN
ncbi:MAG: sulfite exporter TauE/SafE family protein [Candidatus Omnitrophota bacterium]|nr:sulfite exporter TauE/SafE family protein [Candidatus Omnitrophota bacterium]